MKKVNVLRKLVKEQVKAILREQRQSFEVDPTTTVGDLVAFLSQLPQDLKIRPFAAIESGRSTSVADPAELCSFEVDGNDLVIDVRGEETDWD